MYGCTVQIRHGATRALAGAGLLVTQEGMVLTCGCVARAAGIDLQSIHATGDTSDTPPAAPAQEVTISFPRLRGARPPARVAVLYRSTSDRDDALVLLQIVGEPLLLPPDQVAILGSPEKLYEHPFQAISFSDQEDPQLLIASGSILRTIGLMEERLMQTDLLKLQSRQITPCFAGAPVLDRERNLVVGVISHTSTPDTLLPAFGEDTAALRDIAWATSTHSLNGLSLPIPIQDHPLPRQSSPRPRTDPSAARAMAAVQPGIALHGAPPAPVAWVGRSGDVAALHKDWENHACHICVQVGATGEGKTSLARRWLTNLVEDKTHTQPDSIFWWNFHERPSVDEFLIEALAHLSQKRVDDLPPASTTTRVQLLGGMLARGRYLFVLDGLDALQPQDHAAMGNNRTLHTLLSYLATPVHRSFCLVTSRTPLPDLIAATTCTHRSLKPLAPTEGAALLRMAGVQGDDEVLEQLATLCGGHAGTLWLAGLSLRDLVSEPLVSLADVPFLAEGAAELWAQHMVYTPSEDDLRHIVRRYHTYLTAEEHLLLLFLCAFRRPVPESTIGRLIRAAGSERDHLHAQSMFTAPLTALDDEAFMLLFQRLVSRHILFFDEQQRAFHLVPLLADYYRHWLYSTPQGDVPALADEQLQHLHTCIKVDYLTRAGTATPAEYSYRDMVPLIEAVFHALCAGAHGEEQAYGEAWHIYWERIAQRNAFVIGKDLGMYETTLALLSSFLPRKGNDVVQQPWTPTPDQQQHIYEAMGMCLVGLGYLDTAVSWYEQRYQLALMGQDRLAVLPTAYQLLELYACAGSTTKGEACAHLALERARQEESRRDELLSLAYQAWIAHLRGALTMAGATFFWAEALERELNPNVRHLYSLRGTWHATHLVRTGNWTYARQIVEANQRMCESNHWRDELSRCHRVLAELDACEGAHEQAHTNYTRAVEIARLVSTRSDILIEALLARGTWAARRARAEMPHHPEQSGTTAPDSHDSVPHDKGTPADSPKKSSRRRIAITHVEDDGETFRPPEPPPRDRPAENEPTTPPQPVRRGGGTQVWIVGDKKRGFVVTKVAPVERGERNQTARPDDSGDGAKPVVLKSTSGTPSAYGRVLITVDKTDARATRIDVRPLGEGSEGWQSDHEDPAQVIIELARSDLYEALTYAVEAGCRMYEADIRIGLAWLHYAEGNHHLATREAHFAQHISTSIGYFWGQTAAADVLAAHPI